MNSLFTQIKSHVTARQAAERYGIPVSRSGMARCVFHDDHHPSMKIDERFYCFGCHATGDVIDFTAKLFGLSPYEAAKKLADDFDICPLPPGQSAPIPKLSAEVMERKEEQRVLGLLVDYERLLTKWKEDFAPMTPDTEVWDERFCQAVRHQIPVGYAIECLISSDPAERKDMMDYIRSTDTAAQIEEILKHGLPEVKNRGREKNCAA